MDTGELIDKLRSLFHLDVDAVHSYNQAIKNIDVSDYRQQLSRYRDDHERHIKDLSERIRALGVAPPDYSRDFKGFFLESFAAILSTTGTEGALQAMKSAEEITNHSYRDSISWDVDQDTKSLLKKNYDDEKRHLQWIEQTLNSRAWEKVGASAR
jgi:rubrerythrin